MRLLQFAMLVSFSIATTSCSSDRERSDADQLLVVEVHRTKQNTGTEVDLKIINNSLTPVCSNEFNIGQGATESIFVQTNGAPVATIHHTVGTHVSDDMALVKIRPNERFSFVSDISRFFLFEKPGQYQFIAKVPLLPCDREDLADLSLAHETTYGPDLLYEEGVRFLQSKTFEVVVSEQDAARFESEYSN